MCKASRICVVGDRGIKNEDIFVEENDDNNFSLELFFSGWGKIWDK